MDVVHPVHGVGEPFPRRIAQHGFDLRAHIMPGAAGAEFGDISNGGEALDQSAIAGFGCAKFGPGPVMFDRDAREMSGVGDELEMLNVGPARLPIIDGEGAEYPAVLRSNWR